MKFVYFAPSDIQVPRVDRQCIVAFCSALAELAIDVELVAMRIRVMASEPSSDDPLDLYRIRRRFKTQLISVPVTQTSGSAWMAINRLVVHAAAALRLLRQRGADGGLVLYTKTHSTLWFLLVFRSIARLRASVVFEAHVPPRNALQHLGLKRADRVVANTHALARDLVQQGDLRPESVLGIHQGVDLELVEEARRSKSAARAVLGLPADAKLVVYTGKIYCGYDEVEYLLEAARLLEDRDDILFTLVGGREDHVSRFRARAIVEQRGNVRFAGFVRPAAVLDYQFAADALVTYYPSGHPLNEYRSPGKLFEYMAVGRPIVAMDLPVLREVLGEEPAAAMVPADSPQKLSAELVRVIDDPALSERLAQGARSRAELFSWRRRAEDILEFIARPRAGRPQEPNVVELSGARNG